MQVVPAGWRQFIGKELDVMKILISDERGLLNRVKCPRPNFPPVPLEACKKCRWYVSIQIPADDRAAYVVCHLEGEWYNAPLVPGS